MYAIPPEKVSITGFVNDYTKTLNSMEIGEINAIGEKLYATGKVEYAVVIIDSLQGYEIQDYALKIAQGRLGESEKNNGLLLLISLEDRSYRFEVGRGLEGDLNDAYVGRIGRYYLVPNFQNESYGKGIIEASKIIEQTFLDGDEIELRDVYGIDNTPSIIDNVLTLIVLAIVFIFVFGGKHGRKNRVLGLLLLSSFTRGGRGGMGGGFNGFGKGGFGGGGAGGRW